VIFKSLNLIKKGEINSVDLRNLAALTEISTVLDVILRLLIVNTKLCVV